MPDGTTPRPAPRIVRKATQMQIVGALLAVLGTALIVFAALQAAAALFGDSILLALIVGVAVVVLLALGGWMMLRQSRLYSARPS